MPSGYLYGHTQRNQRFRNTRKPSFPATKHRNISLPLVDLIYTGERAMYLAIAVQGAVTLG